MNTATRLGAAARTGEKVTFGVGDFLPFSRHVLTCRRMRALNRSSASSRSGIRNFRINRSSSSKLSITSSSSSSWAGRGRAAGLVSVVRGVGGGDEAGAVPTGRASAAADSIWYHAFSMAVCARALWRVWDERGREGRTFFGFLHGFVPKYFFGFKKPNWSLVTWVTGTLVHNLPLRGKIRH